MEIVKLLAKRALVLAVLYIVFRYFVAFSEGQSVVLTFLFYVGYGLYEQVTKAPKPEQTFTPFCVSFLPNWHELLTDLTLIKGKEDWAELCDAAHAIPAGKFNVFKHGFTFTVIKPPTGDRGLLPGLTFWDNEKGFLSELELNRPIVEKDADERMMKGKHKLFDHPSWSNLPCVVFKWGVKGYELGLEVQLDWWEERIKSGVLKELSKIETDPEHRCGTTRLVIATLPYSEFAGYYEAVDYKQLPKLRAEWDKQLETYGWKRAADDDSEFANPWLTVEHKYFSVSHREL